MLSQSSDEVEFDVPDEVEGALGQLFELLVDKVSVKCIGDDKALIRRARIQALDGQLPKASRVSRIDFHRVLSSRYWKPLSSSIVRMGYRPHRRSSRSWLSYPGMVQHWHLLNWLVEI